MIVNNFQDHLKAVERFSQAEERLDNALKQLEELVLSKISSLQELGGGANSLLQEDLEKLDSIDNLNTEINNLQKTLAEVGAENEQLIAENKMLHQKIAGVKNLLPEVIAEIEVDLLKINSLMKK